MAVSPRRLLVMSHSAVTHNHLRKWRLLAKATRWDIQLVVPAQWPEGGVKQSAEEEQDGSLHIAPLPAMFAGKLGYAWLRGFSELATLAAPDAIYAEEEPFIPMAWQAVQTSNELNVPLALFTWENQRRPLRFWQKKIRREALGRANRIIAGNIEAAEILREKGYREEITVMPQYGVNTKVKPVEPAADQPFTVVYAGRLVPEKGIDLLIKAAEGKGWQLRFAGTGSEEIRLKALALRLNVNVDFMGYQQGHEVDFYRGAHALALPSRETPVWKEQFGRVLVEAMARGLPCVASRTGAIPEVLGSGGLLFDDGDVSGLRENLSRLAGSPALRKKLGSSGRKKAVKDYSEDVITKKMELEFETLIRGRR